MAAECSTASRTEKLFWSFSRKRIMPELRSKSESSTRPVGLAGKGGGDVQRQRRGADARFGRQEGEDLRGGFIAAGLLPSSAAAWCKDSEDALAIERKRHEFAHAQAHHGAQHVRVRRPDECR